MSEARRASTLARAAQLYYVDGLTQAEVAQQLHTTRSNVSRMLQAARDQGIVRVEVVHPLPRQVKLERVLRDAFPRLQEVRVLAADATPEGEDPLGQVGALAARWLESHVRDGLQVTLSWGRSLLATVEAVQADRAYDVHVGQIGGDLQVNPALSGHELVRTLAAKLGGSYDYIHAPALCSSRSVSEELRTSPSIALELDRARHADLALVGIGGFGEGFSAQLLESAHLTDGEREDLQRLRPVGDIAARFYDVEGRALGGPLTDRVLGIDLDDLRGIDTVVGVAAGRAKAAGILGALRADLLDVLVCDQPAAATIAHALRSTNGTTSTRELVR